MNATGLHPAGTRVRIRVPASTSNMGPGFNSMGVAVDLWNDFAFTLLDHEEDDRVVMEGDVDESALDPANNLALDSARRFLREQRIDVAPCFFLEARIGIPFARGLGSSSTAVVAGVLAANALLLEPRPQAELLDFAVALEGHPDNAAPAILGGFVISAFPSRPLCWVRETIHPGIAFLFLIPEEKLATATARSVLPPTVPHQDAVRNASRTPIVARALAYGDLALLRESIGDRLHMPYRLPLFPGYAEYEAAAHAAGAAGFCVSGAGSALLAICPHEAKDRVAAALDATSRRLNRATMVKEIPPTNQCATVVVTRD